MSHGYMKFTLWYLMLMKTILFFVFHSVFAYLPILFALYGSITKYIYILIKTIIMIHIKQHQYLYSSSTKCWCQNIWFDETHRRFNAIPNSQNNFGWVFTSMVDDLDSRFNLPSIQQWLTQCDFRERIVWAIFQNTYATVPASHSAMSPTHRQANVGPTSIRSIYTYARPNAILHMPPCPMEHTWILYIYVCNVHCMRMGRPYVRVNRQCTVCTGRRGEQVPDVNIT